MHRPTGKATSDKMRSIQWPMSFRGNGIFSIPVAAYLLENSRRLRHENSH